MCGVVAEYAPGSMEEVLAHGRNLDEQYPDAPRDQGRPLAELFRSPGRVEHGCFRSEPTALAPWRLGSDRAGVMTVFTAGGAVRATGTPWRRGSGEALAGVVTLEPAECRLPRVTGDGGPAPRRWCVRAHHRDVVVGRPRGRHGSGAERLGVEQCARPSPHQVGHPAGSTAGVEHRRARAGEVGVPIAVAPPAEDVGVCGRVDPHRRCMARRR